MLEWRRRFKSVLDALGIRASFEAMPAEVRDQVSRRLLPDPVLEFDASFPADIEFTRLRATLADAFRRATFQDDFGTTMSVRDFCSILPTLDGYISGTRVARAIGQEKKLNAACRRFLDVAGPRVTEWMTLSQTAWLALHAAVIVPLVERSRLDGRFFRATLLRDPAARDAKAVRMRCFAEHAQSDRATLDGESRPIHRVGTSNEWCGIHWASWTGATTGAADADRELPVYAQSHALRQLRSRIDLPTFAPWLEYWMYRSLKDPAIVERLPDGDVLVAYELDGCRLGYLVVTPMADRVVVRTFLFLTMAPSPEARQLEQQLRLRRHDVNWLGLHELSAFTRSDLLDDTTLRPMLDACGCGHLFDLSEVDPSPTSRAVAAEMKRYLRIAA